MTRLYDSMTQQEAQLARLAPDENNIADESVANELQAYEEHNKAYELGELTDMELIKIRNNETNPVAIVALRQDNVFQALRNKAGIEVIADEATLKLVRNKPTKDEYEAMQRSIVAGERYEGGFSGKLAVKTTPIDEIWECTHYDCKDVSNDPNEIYPGDLATITRDWDNGETRGTGREFSILCARTHNFNKRSDDGTNNATAGSRLHEGKPV
jgi:hypothetical protein